MRFADRVAFILYKYELVYLTRRLKRFNLEAVVNLGEAIVKLEISIYILGLYIDRKLK